MAENTIEIEVELVGQDKALEGLDEIKDGAEGIGETFKGVGDIVGKTNEQLGDSLSAVSDAVGSGVEAFQGMRDAMGEVAAGTAGISALVGPIGLLTVAIGGAYEAYRQFTGAAQKAKEAGAKGFGFGPTILHVDFRPSPAGWGYSSRFFGNTGKTVKEMIASIKE